MLFPRGHAVGRDVYVTWREKIIYYYHFIRIIKSDVKQAATLDDHRPFQSNKTKIHTAWRTSVWYFHEVILMPTNQDYLKHHQDIRWRYVVAARRRRWRWSRRRRTCREPVCFCATCSASLVASSGEPTSLWATLTNWLNFLGELNQHPSMSSPLDTPPNLFRLLLDLWHIGNTGHSATYWSGAGYPRINEFLDSDYILGQKSSLNASATKLRWILPFWSRWMFYSDSRLLCRPFTMPPAADLSNSKTCSFLFPSKQKTRHL